MKRILTLLLCCTALFAGCEKSDKNNDGLRKVSDVTKKMNDPKFIEYCLTYFDTDYNGKLSMTEAEAVTKIDFTDLELNLTTLAGIEYFTNLEWLDCENNRLTELDLSYNTNLQYLYCSRNQLMTLKLPAKAPWGEVGNVLNTIHCSQNMLTELDASNSVELQRLSCWNNQLTTLKIGESWMLHELDCSDNRLSGTLDLRNSREITELDSSENPDLKELWLFLDLAIPDFIKDYETKIVRFENDNIPVKIGVPDRYFREYLLNRCDTNGNGILSSEEVATVTEIDLENLNYGNIVTYEGIEHLTNLTKIWKSGDWRSGNGSVKTLDLSKNINLSYIDVRSLFDLETLYLIAGHAYEEIEVDDDVTIIYK